jgi:hypothetical protein
MRAVLLLAALAVGCEGSNSSRSSSLEHGGAAWATIDPTGGASQQATGGAPVATGGVVATGGTSAIPSATGGILATGGAATGGSSSCPDGNERCNCYGNGTCNAGLTCASRLCVALGVGAGAGSAGAAAGGTKATGGAATGGKATGGKGNGGESAGSGASGGGAGVGQVTLKFCNGYDAVAYGGYAALTILTVSPASGKPQQLEASARQCSSCASFPFGEFSFWVSSKASTTPGAATTGNLQWSNYALILEDTEPLNLKIGHISDCASFSPFE